MNRSCIIFVTIPIKTIVIPDQSSTGSEMSYNEFNQRINRNSTLFGNCRKLWPCFIDLQNFILLVRTVPFFRKIFFISSYTEKNNYFLLYELIQDLPYPACNKLKLLWLLLMTRILWPQVNMYHKYYNA